jgi:hypothetical protein
VQCIDEHGAVRLPRCHDDIERVVERGDLTPSHELEGDIEPERQGQFADAGEVRGEAIGIGIVAEYGQALGVQRGRRFEQRKRVRSVEMPADSHRLDTVDFDTFVAKMGRHLTRSDRTGPERIVSRAGERRM